MTSNALLIGAVIALSMTLKVQHQADPLSASDSAHRTIWTATSKNNNLGNGQTCNGKDGANDKDGENGGNCGSNNNESSRSIFNW